MMLCRCLTVDQSKVIYQVNETISSVTNMSQQSLSLSAQVNKASDEIALSTNQLLSFVSSFKSSKIDNKN